jgi:tetratricopeptide (TPR) repeat protein
MSSLISALYQRSVLLKASGKFYDAEPLAREYLEISKRLHGEEHPDVGVALANLASIYEDMENNDEALRHYDQCLELRQRLFQVRTAIGSLY